MTARFMGEGDLSALYDAEGRRKYLNDDEGARFLAAAARANPATRALCRLLSYTGCRISEALELTPRRIDVAGGRVVFRTLKRRRTVFRAVPIPAALAAELTALAGEDPEARLWPISRQTGWRRIKRVMLDAGVEPALAAPRALRHRFGLRAAEHGVPMATAQRWLGHASLRTTALYQIATGPEERRLAGKLWPLAA